MGMKITIENQYNTVELKDSKKMILKYLRADAHGKRTTSRIVGRLEDNVHAISEKLHPSELVTMAAFKLNDCGVEKLIELLNNYGVVNYKLEDENEV